MGRALSCQRLRSWRSSSDSKRVDRDADGREERQGGEDLGDFQAVAGFDDAPGEAGRGAGAGGEFGDDGADEGEAACDLHAGQHVGQRGGELQPHAGVCRRVAR